MQTNGDWMVLTSHESKKRIKLRISTINTIEEV